MRFWVLVSSWLLIWPLSGNGFSDPPQSEKPLWTTREKDLQANTCTCRSAGIFSSLVESFGQAVVGLEVHFDQSLSQQAKLGRGSGFFIRQDGYLVTNHHVIENAVAIRVKTINPTGVYGARVVGTDAYSDLALLKVEAQREMPVLPLGDSSNLSIGCWVAAVANPYGLNRLATVGIVSGMGRILRDLDENKSGVYDLIQTDALISAGSSGGALINPCGEVIGVITAANQRARGIGFAIPVDLVKVVLPRLLHDGTLQRAYLGLRIDALSWEIAARTGMQKPIGVLVTKVVANTPASRSGLRPGDVLLKFAGQSIRGPGDMNWRASTAAIGKKVDIELMRKTTSLVLPIVPVARKTKSKSVPDHRLSKPVPQAVWLGLRVVNREPVRAKAALPGQAAGVVVVGFDSESAAKRLRVGDVIVEVQGEKISDVKAFRKIVQRHRHRSAVRLTLLRQGRMMYVAL